MSCPSHPADAWSASTHTSIVRMPGEDSVQKMTSHFLLLCSGESRGKEAACEKILLR